jgi:hypothetical protein
LPENVSTQTFVLNVFEITLVLILFFFSFNERLLKLIEELITSDLLSNECAWTTFLTNGVEERYADAAKWLEQRTVIMNDGIAKRRTDEIEDHQNILERHIKVIRKICHNESDLIKRYDDTGYTRNERAFTT